MNDERIITALERAIARIQQLEAALREIAFDDITGASIQHKEIARAALAQSSPPARQENDDVFKGFRGNNEA